MRAKIIYQNSGKEHPNVKPLEVYGNSLLLEGTDGGHANIVDRLYIRFNNGFEFRQTPDEAWMPIIKEK